MPAFFTYPTRADQLEAGQVYVTGTVGGAYETREVLELLQLTPMGGALLEVKDPRGDIFRSRVNGRVQVVEGA